MRDEQRKLTTGRRCGFGFLPGGREAGLGRYPH
jgi:hypothetical protein